MSRRRPAVQAARTGHGAVLGFGAVTAIALAVTVYLANQASALKADERAFTQARPCATQKSGSRDCIDDVASTAVGSPWHVYKNPDTKLKVSFNSKMITLAFPHRVGSMFMHIQDGDFVDLTTWRGDIVAAGAQGDTENTTAAPSARYDFKMAGVFFAAAFTLVLAGVTLFSATWSRWFHTERRVWLGHAACAVLAFGGVAAIVSAAVMLEGGTLHTAVLTAPIIVVAGVIVAGGVALWRRFRHLTPA